MNNRELASAMRRAASAIEQLPGDYRPGAPPMLDGELALGGACVLAYLRSLLTVTTKETFSRDELLVMVADVAIDRDVFAGNMMGMLDMLSDDEPETDE